MTGQADLERAILDEESMLEQVRGRGVYLDRFEVVSGRTCPADIDLGLVRSRMNRTNPEVC